jgi:hypothetical protein
VGSEMCIRDIYKSINKTINYIEGGNYFGDLYHKYYEEQIKANDDWITTFYPIDKKDIKTTKKMISDILEESIKISTEKINNLKKNIYKASSISLPSS